MRVILITYFILIVQIGLAQTSRLYTDSTIQVDVDNVPMNGQIFYFPTSFFPDYQFSSDPIDSSSVLVSKMYTRTLHGDTLDFTDTLYTYSTKIPDSIDTLMLSWFSEQLFALNEPLLFNRTEEKTVYRFTWLRTFHNPISIRVEKELDEIFLYTKIGSGAAGYDPEGLKISKKKRITATSWKKLEAIIEAFDFWNKQNYASLPSTDGSRWILEGRTPDKYYVYSRKSPSDECDFYKLCEYLIELSGIRVKKRDWY